MRYKERIKRTTTAPSTWSAPMKWLLAIAFWTVVGLLFSTQHILLIRFRGEEVTMLEAMRVAMPRWYLWGLSTPLIFQIHHRFPVRWNLPKHLLGHLLLGFCWAGLVEGLNFLIHRLLGGTLADRAATIYLASGYWDVVIYWLIIGISSAWRYASEMQQRELKAAQLEKRLTEARLHALASQLNPHFLFNALNAISAYTEQEPRTARRMMAQLGELLRFSLDHASHQDIQLSNELGFLENYLEIERRRFEGRLTVGVEADPQVYGALVPSFLLQPLVENAIRHGISKRKRGGHVDVAIRRAGRTLVIRVQDDGVGLPEGWQLDQSEGVGLRNLTERLEELYGARHTFHIEGLPGQGVRVEVTIPYREGPPGARTAHPYAEVLIR